MYEHYIGEVADPEWAVKEIQILICLIIYTLNVKIIMYIEMEERKLSKE